MQSHFLKGDALEDEERFEEAFVEFLAGAEAGDTSCMVRLANLYTKVTGIPCCDYEKALEWETKAHAAGDDLALINLGITYRLKGDIRKSKECFEAALDTGNNSAALELARLYMVSEKEKEMASNYLKRVISDYSLSEAERDEAKELLSKL